MRRLTILFVLSMSMVVAAVAYGEVAPAPVTSVAPFAHIKARGVTRRPARAARRKSRAKVSSVSAGHAEAFRFEETVDTTVQTIKVDLSPGSTARTLVAGLYTSTRGQPEQLIASGSASVPANAGSVSVPVKPRYLAKDSGYWIAVLGVGGAVNTGTDQSSSCRSATTDAGSLTALPKSWGTGTRSNECASASVTYKPTTSAASTTSGLLTVPPVNTAAPTISGTAQEASTLTASTGSWTGSPTSYAYQWQDCSSLLCSNISGATGSSYTLRASDIGDTIDVVVTAANGGKKK